MVQDRPWRQVGQKVLLLGTQPCFVIAGFALLCDIEARVSAACRSETG